MTVASTGTALEGALALAKLGVPLFLAESLDLEADSWAFPAQWQHTPPGAPSLQAVENWREGLALCAVTGHVLDVLDRDPRNGGDWAALQAAIAEIEGEEAPVVAESLTPSGGEHLWVWSLGVGKRRAVPGIDYQGGDPAGEGRGFVYVPPTRRRSKVTGEVRGYEWRRRPPAGRAPGSVNGPRTRLARFLAAGRAGGEGGGIGTLAERATPAELLSGLPRGDQDNQLSAWMFRLAGRGLSRLEMEVMWDAAVAAIRRAGQETVTDPFTERDRKRHVSGALRKLELRRMPPELVAWAEAREAEMRAAPPEIAPGAAGAAPGAALAGDPEFLAVLRGEYLRAEAREVVRRERQEREQEAVRWLSGSEVLSLPPVAELVAGRLPLVGVGALFGAARQWKSFAALHLMCRVMAGGQWAGGEVLAPGHVTYLIGEGQGDAGQRLRAAFAGYPAAAAVAERLLYAVTPFDITAPARLAEVEERVLEASRAAGAPPRLVMFDALADFNPGGENAVEEANAVIAAAKRLAGTLSCLVMPVAHTGLVELDRMRGSSRWHQAWDIELAAARGEDGRGDVLTLRCTKLKHAADGWELHLVADAREGSLSLREAGAMETVTLVAENAEQRRRDLAMEAAAVLRGVGGRVRGHAVFRDMLRERLRGSHRTGFADEAITVARHLKLVRMRREGAAIEYELVEENEG